MGPGNQGPSMAFDDLVFITEPTHPEATTPPRKRTPETRIKLGHVFAWDGIDTISRVTAIIALRGDSCESVIGFDIW